MGRWDNDLERGFEVGRVVFEVGRVVWLGRVYMGRVGRDG